MKNYYFLFVLIFFCFPGFSQVPDAFNYQAVIRNSSGEVIADQDVSFRISILEDSGSGTPVYTETHSATTNKFGLVNLHIGDGNVVDGDFQLTEWGAAPHFIKIEFDTEGGASYIHMGTSQLLSVPYAVHAQTVENDEVEDADADPSNELQTLSVSDHELSISDGNSVTLPDEGSLWMQNGSEIYFDDHVGIGTDNPNFELDIYDNSTAAFARIASGANNASLIIERSGPSNMSGIIHKTGPSNTFYAGLLGSSSYKISTDNPNLQGLEVKNNGDVLLSDELNSARTGEANMMPFAYGHISDDGTNQGSTSNVEAVTKLATGQYKVEIPDLGTVYTAIVTPNRGVAYLTGVVASRTDTFFTVNIWDTKNDRYEDGGFSFVIYKP